MREWSSVIYSGLIGVLFWAPNCLSWYDHHYITPLMWKSEDNRLVQILNTRVKSICAQEAAQTYALLAQELELNPHAEIESYSRAECGPGAGETTIEELVAGTAIDDPDKKIDQDLPPAYDKADERKWMGGTEGVQGQGFRHMYFAGWSWRAPLATFQIPSQPIGQAPMRIQLFAQRAKQFIREGNLEWGTRLLIWAMHYAQDLTQPFHTAQFPSLHMLAWYELLSWPFGGNFDRMISESTIITRNFHWAYEAYVRNQFIHPALLPYGECLSSPETKNNLIIQEGIILTPAELSTKIVTASQNLSSPLGGALHRFFGNQLNRKGVDMAKTPNHLDYDDYATRPELIDERAIIHDLTCQAMANASFASRQLLKWAFQP